MNPGSPASFKRMAILAMAGASFSVAVAQETSSGLPPELGAILGIGSGRLLEIQEIAAQAQRSGELRQGMSALAAIARTSREAGDRAAWVEAELAWVTLAAKEGEEPELDDALEVLVSRSRDWGLARQESEVFRFWSGLLVDEGKWLDALRALDGAFQASLSAGMVNDAVRALLAMSQICRDNDHPWRLQQVWLRMNQVESEMAASIETATRTAIEAERAAASSLLALVVPVAAAAPKVNIQPSQAAVKVSAPHGEVGRARFVLTNETLRTVSGSLEVKSETGALKKWESGHDGHWLTLGDKTKTPEISARKLSLRPGERVSIYMEREQPAGQDSVRLLWSGVTEVNAAADFSFAPAQPETSFVNAGAFAARPGWGVPFYHELNYRGDGLKVEDFQFQSNVPCRLEILDIDGGTHPSVDAGTLLAVDAEGDGFFTGAGDRVFSDSNGDGTPDVIIGDRTRSLEIYAWPLTALPAGTELTVSAQLRRPGQPAAWRKDAEDALQIPQTPSEK